MKKIFSIVAILSLVLSPVTPAFAVDSVWSGLGGDSNFSTAGNWSSGGVPSGTAVYFNGAVGGPALSNDLAAGTVFDGIRYGGSSGAYTINGSAFNLTSGIVHNDDNLQTINAAITLNNALQFGTSSSGSLTVGNVANGGSLLTLSANGGTTITMSGVISDGGGLNINNTGIVTFSGGAQNTFTGTTTVSSGTVNLNAGGTNSISGNLTISGGTVEINSGNQIKDTSNVVVSGGTFDINGLDEAVNGVQLTSGNINGSGGRLASSTAFDMQSGSVSAILNGAVGLNKTTSGTVTLTGVNVFNGQTSISGGTLSINNVDVAGNAQALGSNATVAISGGAILEYTGGAGTMGKAVALGASGGTVKNSGSGLLTLTGGATTASGQNLTIDGASDVTISTTKITGAGGLIKNGNGTLSLNIANDYTGATSITDGILKMGVVGALGTGEGSQTSGVTVLSGAALDLNGVTPTANVALNLNGTATGTAGALTNSNASAATYAGAVTLQNASSIGSNSGDITLSGVINGALALTKVGSDKLTLTNNTNGATTTTITAGTLNIGGGTLAGALGSGLVTNSGTLTIERSNAFSIGSANAISGTGAFIQAGTGTTTITAANSYLGLTTISGGVLNIQNATALGTTAEGTVVNDTKALQLQGGIAVGPETLSLTGTGVVATGALRNISGNNSWAGAVTLGGGATRINSDADTLTISGAIGGVGQNLTVGGAGNTTISGVIGTGGGALTYDGSGTLTISNSNTHTGLTSVTSGTLAYSASVSQDSSLTNSSIVNLGTNTITLATGKAYTQIGASALNLTINGSTFGNITGDAAAVMAGTNVVNVTVGSTYLANGATFTIVNTAEKSVGAVPTTITSSNNIVGFTASGASGDLVLTVNRSSADAAVASVGGNAQNAWNVLEKIGQNGPMGDILTVLNTLDTLTGSQVATAVATMTPDVSSGTAQSSRAATANSLTMISNRLGGARNGGTSGVSSADMMNGVGVWAQGLGSNIKQDERKGIQGYSANLFGTTIGADKVIDNHFRAGLAGGYGWAGVHSKTPGSPSDDINSYQATVYGSYDSLDLNKARQHGKKSYEAVRSQVEDSWYVDGMVAFTQNNYDSRREIWLTPTNARVAKADHYGQQYSTNFEAGYKFVFEETKALEVTPFVSLGYNYLYMNTYKEKGADALNLSVQGKGFNQLEQGLGTKLSYPIVAKKVGTFIPSAKAAWLYDYIADRFETDASFAGGGSSFTTNGAKPAKNGMLFGAELAFLNKGNMTVTGNWDIELKDQYMANTYYGTVRYDF